MAEKLKVGDVVRLKSGGPLMTVMEVFMAVNKRKEVVDKTPLECTQCSWTLATGQMASETFPSVCVELIPQDGAATVVAPPSQRKS